MNPSRLLNILRYPLVTEKTTILSQQNCIVYRVLNDATKDEIRLAVESILGKQVVSVRTINMRGKQRRSARGYGRCSDWKKAYITLAEGEITEVEGSIAEKESN